MQVTLSIFNVSSKSKTWNLVNCHGWKLALTWISRGIFTIFQWRSANYNGRLYRVRQKNATPLLIDRENGKFPLIPLNVSLYIQNNILHHKILWLWLMAGSFPFSIVSLWLYTRSEGASKSINWSLEYRCLSLLPKTTK